MANSSLDCNSGSYTLVGAAAFAALVLSIASGAYTVTGTAATFVHGYRLTAVSGNYAITGQPIQSRRITAEPAGYILNGTPATLTRTNRFVFSSAAGSYAVTGASSQVEKAIPYTKGVYGVTGTVATLSRSSANLKIPIVSGVYGITGGSTVLIQEVNVVTGDYQITGAAVIFRNGKGLIISPGAYALLGPPSTRLEQSHRLPSASGSYAITGAITTLRYSPALAKFLVLNSDNYTLTGANATLRWLHAILGSSGTYTVTGTTAAPKKTSFVVSASGLYTVSGTDAAVRRANQSFVVLSGTYNLVGTPASLYRRIPLTAAIGSYNHFGQNTIITYRQKFFTGTYNLTGVAAGLSHTNILSANSGTYSITGGPTSLLFPVKLLLANSGVYTSFGFTAGLTNPKALVATSGTYQLIGINNTLRVTRLTVESGTYGYTGSPVTLLTTHKQRWKPQPGKGPGGKPQPYTTSSWDTQPGSTGV